MNSASNRDLAVFTEALELPAEERAAFVERACAGDDQLRQKVRVLLQVHDRVGDFLEPSVAAAAVGEKPGDQVGHYKLLQQIGEGGCGVVFMAEQEEPVRRRVALKLVKPGMETKSVIARFEAERQALALMEHPNIAQVYDAGVTANGRPYFVMELVRGVKITDYCDQHALTTNARLEMFLRVCDAVQHAHQKGIIHRDIKPSNILVTSTLEGKALPKVIDFGIAKATNGQRLSDKTLFTAFHMLIGTPAYMSPEQAALTSVDVDTRTDIYSLGVLLYELLTGTTPFDTQELLKSGLDEVRRVIRDQEPVRPSTRLNTMLAADLTSVSGHRRAEPPKLIRELRGDLDWVVMKAIEKDRTRRYQTASGMAADVQHFLANEPVSACPPSAWYKFRKLVSRNKIWFGATAAISGILVVALIAVSLALAKEERALGAAETARKQADKEKNSAREEAATSAEVTRLLGEMLEGVRPSVAAGRDTTMLREMLDATAARLDKEMTNRPAVQVALRRRLGNTYWELSQYDDAEKMMREVMRIMVNVFGEESEPAADAMYELANMLMYTDKPAEAKSLAQKALDLRLRFLGPENLKVADSYTGVAALAAPDSPDEAEALLRKSLAIQWKLLGSNDVHLDGALVGLGSVLFWRHKYPEAEDYFRKAIEVLQPKFDENDGSLLAAQGHLAVTLATEGKNAEAETLYRQVAATGRKLYGSGRRPPYFARELADMGRFFAARGRYPEAESAFRESLAAQRKTKDDARPELLETFRGLKDALAKQHKFEDIERVFAELMQPGREFDSNSVILVEERCAFFARRGRWNEARADAELALKLEPDDHQNYHTLAPLLVAAGDVQAYQDLCAKIVARFGGTKDIFTADRMGKDCLILASAVADLKPVAEMAELTVTKGERFPAYPFFQCAKALADYRQGNYSAAVEMSSKALKAEFPYSDADASAILAMAQFQLKKTAEAQASLARCAAVENQDLPKLESGDLGSDWRDWIIAHALLAEAKSLIEGSTSSPGNAGAK